ncbi:MAG: hypothetical protein CM1200mP11_3050 [Nitrosopumilaceae archaeon]|nr:MAG: hypothetical protein CM1200mP11_3050 [Nitrosopumilaceae archaeon]
MSIYKITTSCRKTGSYTVIRKSFRMKVKKKFPFRALETLDWEVPDWLVYPGGH